MSAEWVPEGDASTLLKLSFQIVNSYGAPVNFVDPRNAVIVFGWTSRRFDPAIYHITEATVSKDGSTWFAQVPGVDPRDGVAHIEFDVRDPRASPMQCEPLEEDFSFNDVPVPVTLNTFEPLDRTFTTPWGAVITLEGLMRDSTSLPMHYYFRTDTSRVPDEYLNLSLFNAFDKGTPITSICSGAGYEGGKTPGTFSLLSGPIDPAVDKAVDLQFHSSESSESKIYTTPWLPLHLDVQLLGLKPPVQDYTVLSSTQFIVDSVKYRLQQVKFPAVSLDGYILSSIPAVGNVTEAIADGSKMQGLLSRDGAMDHLEAPPSHVYFGADGAPIPDNESAAFYWAEDALPSEYPLRFVCTPTRHDQKVLIFDSIKTPKPGTIRYFGPGVNSLYGMRGQLCSVQWTSASSRSFPVFQNRWTLAPFVLACDFGRFGDQKVGGTVTIVAARDVFGNSLCSLRNSPVVLYWRRMDDKGAKTPPVAFAPPPTGAKSFALKVLCTEDIAAGPPVYLQVNADGELSASKVDSP